MMVMLVALAVTGIYMQWRQDAAPGGLIRLHVIANSNSVYDQELKLKVKDRIVRETAPVFSKAGSAGEARKIADAYTGKIEQVAREEIRRQGYDYQVRVVRGTFHFPAKTYTVKNSENRISLLTLPPGEYEAVRVIIGEGRGANWWCVLYPPLCFVDLEKSAPPVAVPAAAAVEKGPQNGGLENQGDNTGENHTGKIEPGRDDPGEDNPEQPRFQYRFRIVELIKSVCHGLIPKPGA